MKLLISSSAPEEALDSLRRSGYEPLLLPPCPRLPMPTASHADMLVCLDDGGNLICERLYYMENRPLFESTGRKIILSERILAPDYPHDVAFNVLRLRGRLFGLAGAAAPEIVSSGQPFIPVRQGYARCSCCITSDGCAVTADASLAAALEREGIARLVTAAGGIVLPGYDCGFIGGASGLLADGRTALFGELESHPDGSRIADFLRLHGGFVELMRGPLYDVGGFVIV